MVSPTSTREPPARPAGRRFGLLEQLAIIRGLEGVSYVLPGRERGLTTMEDRDDTEARTDRSTWPVRRHALGAEPSDDLSSTTSAAERIAMMWPLALEAWSLARLPIPTYPRDDPPALFLREGAS
jgi:hypothetical protein